MAILEKSIFLRTKEFRMCFAENAGATRFNTILLKLKQISWGYKMSGKISIYEAIEAIKIGKAMIAETRRLVAEDERRERPETKRYLKEFGREQAKRQM